MSKISKGIITFLIIIILTITANNLINNANKPFWFNETSDGINNTQDLGGIRTK